MRRLVEFSLEHRLVVLLLAGLLVVGGWIAFRSLPIDAFPDVSPTQVKVIVKAPGMTPEEEAVAREQDAPVAHRDLDEAVVIAVGPVEAVEAEQTQAPHKCPQVAVEHEARRTQGLGPQPDQRPHVEGLEDGVHADPLTCPGAVLPTHRVPVDEDDLDLGVGHPVGLDQVLDRLGLDRAMPDATRAMLPWKQPAQLRVEAQVEPLLRHGGTAPELRPRPRPAASCAGRP